MMLQRAITKNAVFLMLFALSTTFVIALVFVLTKNMIAKNEHNRLLNTLNVLIPAGSYDNSLVNDCIQVRDPELLGTAELVTIYRARKQNNPVALIINAVAPDGYNGRIDLLIALDKKGSVLGVRAPKHKETPGLGDNIDENKTDWVFQFNGRSLEDPLAEQWKVKKDGGHFDQLTGATITPRAIVKALKNTLLYYQQNSDKLWQLASDQQCEK